MLKFAVLSISFVLASGGAISGILPEIQRVLEINQMQADLLLTTPNIAVLIATLYSNVLVSKIGMKKIVLLGLAITGLAGMAPVFIEGFHALIISRFILGLGLGIYNSFAISYISFLFDKREIPTLMGFRVSWEFAGMSLLTVLSGFLLRFGWHISFLLYGAAFIALAIFYKIVPDVDLKTLVDSSEANLVNKKKMPVLVYCSLAFMLITIICAAAIGIRFPSLMAEVHGQGHNSSNVMAAQPIVNILAALSFGRMHRRFGRKILYSGLLALIASLLIIGFSNGNYQMLVVGFFLHGLVPGWVIPFAFQTIARITSGKTQNLAMSLMVVVINTAIFSVPFVIGFIEKILDAQTLSAAYPLLALIMLAVLSTVILLGKRIANWSSNPQLAQDID